MTRCAWCRASAKLPDYEITSRDGSATYLIRVNNPGSPGHGVEALTLDVQSAAGGAVLMRNDGRGHTRPGDAG